MRELYAGRRRESIFCFPSRDGLRPVDFRYPWERAREKACLADFRFHDLRHSAASYLAMSGSNLKEIGAILGNTIPDRYAHLIRDHVAQAVERMNRSVL